MTAAPLADKNRALGRWLGIGALAMVGLAFVSVPLYNLYCRKTGYGGATQVASAVPAKTQAPITRVVKVRFNTDVAPGLNWSFKSPMNEVEVKVGEVQKLVYLAQNLGAQEDVGVAVYNVQPDRAGLYFNKVQCFCFDEKPLKAGEKAELPVQFFIDPAILDDRQMDDVKTITLSYTFFAQKSPLLGEAQKKFDAFQSRLIETAKTVP